MKVSAPLRENKLMQLEVEDSGITETCSLFCFEFSKKCIKWNEIEEILCGQFQPLTMHLIIKSSSCSIEVSENDVINWDAFLQTLHDNILGFQAVDVFALQRDFSEEYHLIYSKPNKKHFNQSRKLD